MTTTTLPPDSRPPVRPSEVTWRRAEAEARIGNWQPLLELLLVPFEEDSHGGARRFYDLPQDQSLRMLVVRRLLFAGFAKGTTLQHLMTHEAVGSNAERLSDREVALVAAAFDAVAFSPEERREIADELGVELPTLDRRVRAIRDKKAAAGKPVND